LNAIIAERRETRNRNFEGAIKIVKPATPTPAPTLTPITNNQ
jgi:hypothetical protein